MGALMKMFLAIILSSMTVSTYADDTEILPIVHRSTLYEVSSLIEPQEMLCNLVDSYEMRLTGAGIKGYVTLATYTTLEKHLLQGNGMTADMRSHLCCNNDFQYIVPNGVTNAVTTTIPGYNLRETKIIVNSAAKNFLQMNKSDVIVMSPKNSILKSGDKGSWKEGRPSEIILRPALSRTRIDSLGRDIPNEKFDLPNIESEKLLVKSSVVKSMSVSELGFMRNFKEKNPVLSLTNTVSVACSNPNLN